ncbi:MAG: ABC transporter ATP-binding protein [Alphaproteobacteria bacterium]
MQPAIIVKGLRKEYGNVVAVAGLDFTVKCGSITALLGGNGAGKTTTIGMLLGILLPTAGKITVLGADMLRNRYAVLPDMNFSSPYVDLPGRLTLRQNLTVYAHLYGVPEPGRRIGELAADLQIVSLLERPYGQLSAGQKTRAALAKALINRPRLLLLDEPTASLDPDTADWVRGYLHDYRQKTGATILLASHHMGEVERLCDHAIMMRTGEIAAEGSPAELIVSYGRTNLEEVFLDIARNRRNPA